MMSDSSSFDSKAPFFSMGPHTFRVSVQDVFGANRRKLAQQLLLAAAATTSTSSTNGNNKNIKNSDAMVLFLKGGESLTRYDSDHEPIFRQESYFYWLTGVKEPNFLVVMEIAAAGAAVVEGNTSGNSESTTTTTTRTTTTLLVPRLPPEYATIMGKIRTTAEWRELYQVDRVRYTDEIDAVLRDALLQHEEAHDANNNNTNAIMMNGNGSHTKKLLLMKGRNSDSGKLYEPPNMEELVPKLFIPPHNDVIIDTDTLFPIFAECRVVKSPAELQILRHVTEITSFAHAYVMRNLHKQPQPQPASSTSNETPATMTTMEYHAESLFRHYCYYNYGCRLTGYTPICGCGPSAAVLHYGHAGEANARAISPGSMGLFDMGAEYFHYGSDVTCSYPVGGGAPTKFTEPQTIIYNAVYKAQVAVYDMIRPGVSWTDCHRAAEAAILRDLVEAGIVVLSSSTVADLVEKRLGAVFMPHGLGHLIGLDTHDVGGYLPGHPERSTLPGLKSLRTARYLRANMVLTVEPGCYFIDHLLDEALANPALAPHLNVDVLKNYRGFGGVRLEDVVQVTDDGVINYTLCPRTIAEVEHVLAGGQWPPRRDDAAELRRVRLCDPTPLPSPPSL